MLALVWRDRDQRFTAGEREPANGIQADKKVERTIPGANVISVPISTELETVSKRRTIIRKNKFRNVPKKS